MKVAVLIDTWFPFVGGGQINAWEISRRIARNGTQVDLITRNCGSDNLKKTPNLAVIKLGRKTLRSDDFARVKYLINSFFYVHKHDYDLVVAHAYLPGLVAKALMLTKKIPAVFVVHGTSIGTNLNSGLKSLLERIILTKIKYSAQITVSRDFLKIKNVNQKIVYIPNGVDIKLFSKTTAVSKKQLLSVARLHPQKNLINLIRAFKKISNELPEYTLIIAGDGPQRKELENVIKELKLSEKVKLMGAVDHKVLKTLYSTSKLFILPSIYEGHPLTLLESMASQLPPLVTKTGDNIFIIKEKQNGFFIKNPKNAQNVYKSIRQVLRYQSLDRIGKNARKTVSNSFNWNKIALETYKIYLSVTK